MRRWRPRRLLGGVASILAGSAAGQGLVFVCYPLLARLYDPSEFGLLVVFTAVVGMLGVLSTASLEAAIPLPTEEKDAAAVAWTSLVFVALMVLLTAATGWVAAAPIADLLGTPALAGLWWLVPVTVAAWGAYAVFSEWMIRDRSYGALGRRNVMQGAGQVTTQIGLGLLGVRPAGLLLGLAVGRLMGIGGLLSKGGLLRQPRPTLAAMRAALVRYRRFPLIASWSRLLNTAGLDAPLLVISAMYGDARAGLLGLTVRVVGGPAAVIGQAMYQVFTGESSARVRDPTAPLASWIRGRVVRLLAIGLVPTLVLIAFGPVIFGVVFGPEWTEAGQFGQILAVSYLAGFAITPISQTLFLLERQGRQLAWDVSRLVLTVGGVVACGVLGASMTTAVTVLAASHVASYALLYFLSINAADRADRQRKQRNQRGPGSTTTG